jgi:hypothetical protein
MKRRPSAVVEAVAISQLGEYLLGGWFRLELMEEGTVNWEDTANWTLRWEEGEIQYTLWFASAKTSNGLPNLNKSALVELAANLRMPSENIIPTPNLTIQEVEALTGFAIIEPANMPMDFALTKAVYSPQYNAACLYYRNGVDQNIPAVTLFESNWAPPTLQDFQTRAFYNGAQVEIATEVETVSVNGADGGTATLITTGIEPGKVCGGEDASVNRALLWQSNGRIFILFASLDQLDGRGLYPNGNAPADLNSAASEMAEVDLSGRLLTKRETVSVWISAPALVWLTYGSTTLLLCRMVHIVPVTTKRWSPSSIQVNLLATAGGIKSWSCRHSTPQIRWRRLRWLGVLRIPQSVASLPSTGKIAGI